MKKGLGTRILALLLACSMAIATAGIQTTPVYAANSAAVTSNFTSETKQIVAAHINDFNASNFNAKMKEYGGYEKYLASLGGIFAQYAGDSRTFKVKTAGDLQACAEYVYGLMCIYGFDYCNGVASKYKKWRKNDGVTADAFYPKGTTNGHTTLLVSPRRIDMVCSGQTKGGLNMTTNCNYSVDYLLHKAGLYGGSGQPNSSCDYKTMINKYGAKVISSASQLQVGDVIECFRTKVTNYSNPSSWSNWYHACIVGEVDKAAGTITLYQGGSAFTNSGNYKQTIKISSGLPYTGWVGIRFVSLDQSTSRSQQSLAAGSGKASSAVTTKATTTTTTKKTTTTTKKTTTTTKKTTTTTKKTTTTTKKTTTTEKPTTTTTEKPTTTTTKKTTTEKPTTTTTQTTTTKQAVAEKPSTSTTEGSWAKNSKGWRYKLADGSYVTADWKNIDGKEYYFDGSGYMKTGWLKLGKTWYYLDAKNGDMETGWKKLSGKWYYLDPQTGAMATGWEEIDGKWFYFHTSNGKMLTGWQKVKGRYYYMSPKNGEMLTGWQKIGKDWYYLNKESGQRMTGWLTLDGKRYYLKFDGKMATGTLKIGGVTYRFGSSGALKES